MVVLTNSKVDLLEPVQLLPSRFVEDATRERVLEAAGVRRATTLTLCTQTESYWKSL
jgi:Trk K+ transport system NAD-binding subunit